jgi:hypothetical protein
MGVITVLLNENYFISCLTFNFVEYLISKTKIIIKNMEHIEKLEKQIEVLLKDKADDMQKHNKYMEDYMKSIAEKDGKIEGLKMAIKMYKEGEVNPIVPTDADVIECVKEYLKYNPKGINRIGKCIPPKLLAKNFKIDGIDIESIMKKSDLFTTKKITEDGKRDATYWILKETNQTELLK